MSVEKYIVISPIRNTIENDNNALLYPPNMDTKAPTKKTATVVKILPVLKQKPVAVPLNTGANSCGIYADNNP